MACHSDTYRCPGGVIIPLFTPLARTGEIDEAATACLLEHTLAAGVQGVFILGSTGEGHSLGTCEQYRFASLVARLVDGRVPLYLGLLQAGTQSIIEFAEGCPAISDYQAVVVGVPYFRFLTGQAEVVDHFRVIHQTINKPVIVYHLPHPASQVLTPNVAVYLAECEGILGWKDSSGKSDCITALLDSGVQRNGFRIYEGGPERSLQSLQQGCDGLIPGPGNFIPHLFSQLYQAVQDEDFGLAQDVQDKIDEFRQFARQSNPFVESGFHYSTFKAGLDVMGIGGGTPAMPYRPLPAEYRDGLNPYFQAAGILENCTQNRIPE